MTNKKMSDVELVAAVRSVIARLRRRGDFDTFSERDVSPCAVRLAGQLCDVSPLTDHEVDVLLGDLGGESTSVAQAIEDMELTLLRAASRDDVGH
jgi:hypothetical protein